MVLKCIDDLSQVEVRVFLSEDLDYCPKFIDVIEIISNYAFMKSEYPLILTIENYC